MNQWDKCCVDVPFLARDNSLLKSRIKKNQANEIQLNKPWFKHVNLFFSESNENISLSSRVADTSFINECNESDNEIEGFSYFKSLFFIFYEFIF